MNEKPPKPTLDQPNNSQPWPTGRREKNYCVDPFCDFFPVRWEFNKTGESDASQVIHSVRREHGVPGQYFLHNLNDEINDSRSGYDKILVEYRIKDISYPVYTVSDLFGLDRSFDKESAGNIMGDVAERIARRITKYFLKHLHRYGKTGGIFNKQFSSGQRDDFIISHNSDYILKIRKYPNLIILKKSVRAKSGYENIKELDGFFDYRYQGQRHIIVLESKLEGLSIDCDDLVQNLFTPLRSLFPDARFSYVLFTNKYSLYQRKTYDRWRELKVFPIQVYYRLRSEGIGSLFFSFNESRDDFERITDHLITQYRAINRKGVTIYGKTIVTEKELSVFDGGETPHIKLIRDAESGLWREVRLFHKTRGKESTQRKKRRE